MFKEMKVMDDYSFKVINFYGQSIFSKNLSMSMQCQVLVLSFITALT